MKTTLLFLLFACMCFYTQAQVVFCPLGAEWHYNFGKYSNLYNEKIKYERDTLIAGDTVKLLSHTRFYNNCNPIGNFYTQIKQKGDTVFFKNDFTLQTWQILYNFAAQTGQSWQVTYLKGIPNTSLTTVTYIVNSVSTVNINNIPLRRLHINSYYITERLGWNRFLFNLANVGCSGDLYAGALCYSDNEIGLVEYTALPCNYSGVVGMEKNESRVTLQVFPNPGKDLFTLRLENFHADFPYQLHFTNLLSQQIPFTGQVESAERQINIHDFAPGIYFLHLYKEGKRIATHKIIKE